MSESEDRHSFASLRDAITACLDVIFNPGPMLDRYGRVVLREDGHAVVDSAAVEDAEKAAVATIRLAARTAMRIPPLTPELLRAYLLANGVTPERIDEVSALLNDDSTDGGA